MDVKPMRKRFIALFAGLLLAPGCSAIYPLRGVPAAYMPEEYKAQSREGKSTIDLSLLQRSQSDQYRIEAGDVLAIYAPGLLGLIDTQPDQPRGDNPPINLPMNTEDRPSLGFPVTVRDDHTIQIPQLPALDVYGLTEREVEDRLKQAVVKSGLIAEERDPRIVVSIMRPRTYRILVCRQEASTAPAATVMMGQIDLGRTGKGTSRVVELRAGENDVAHALAQPGVDGLPGLDARNVIYVIRARNARSRQMNAGRPDKQPTPLTQGRHGHPSREVVIRGQSPSSSPSGSSTGRGPYQYFEATEFKLSGQDIARGENGPPLIDPIPGMNPPLTQRPVPGGAGVAAHGYGAPVDTQQAGLWEPAGPAFRDPAISSRNAAVPAGSPLASDRYESAPMAAPYGNPLSSSREGQFAPTSAAFNDPTYSPRSQASVNAMPVGSGHSLGGVRTNIPGSNSDSAYQAIQYSEMPSGTWPSADPAGLPPTLGSGHSLGQPVLNPMTPAPVDGQGGSEVSFGAGHAGVGDPNPVWQQTLQNFDPTIESSHIIKIPVRLSPGESPNISEEDVTLYDGDIVFIENRDTDVYYVGGLMGGGQFSLPRDRDLHVLEAVSLAQGRGMTQGGTQGMQSSGGVSALNRDVTPSASRLIVLRQVGCGQVMSVEVDLYKALRYPHENILVQPGDMLILQYTCVEATLAFIQRNVLEGALLGIAAGSFQSGN